MNSFLRDCTVPDRTLTGVSFLKPKRMDPAEYLAFIPLLIYGIGITDLLGQWKRFFKMEDRFLLYIIITIMLIEAAIYNVFIYLSVVNELPGHSYIRYLGVLFPPILFQMLVNVFTPDKGSKTREYFNQNLRLIFILMTLFIASHFIYSFNEHYSAHFIRFIYILILTGVAIFRKHWLIYLAIFLWAAGLFFRAFTMAP